LITVQGSEVQGCTGSEVHVRFNLDFELWMEKHKN